MQTTSDVVAAIINWNSAEDTLRCAHAVATGETVPRILVVDNGSAPESVQRLRRDGEPFSLLTLDQNLGYAGGANAAIRYAQEQRASWVWLLNADCVPRPQALSAQLAHADRFAVSVPAQTSSAQPDDPDPEPFLVAAVLPKGKVVPFTC